MLNPEEIKKALNCCEVSGTCDFCPLKSDKKNCVSILSKNAFDLITQYEARIEEFEDKLSDIEANDYY
jgi:hypothetical protein